MARFGLYLLATLLGAVLGAAVGIGLGLIYVELANVSDFEGQSGFVVGFCFAPAGLLLGGGLGIWLARSMTKPAPPAA